MNPRSAKGKLLTVNRAIVNFIPRFPPETKDLTKTGRNFPPKINADERR
jgi:hypothetical protein